MKIHQKKIEAFTLIELLVVVAIIGALAAVGVIAYNGYTSAAKRNATLQNHSQAIKFIKSKLALCELSTSSTLELSSTRTINCDAENDASGINSMNEVFINYFLDKEGILYSPSQTTYLAIILGSTTLFITSCG